MEAAWHTPPSEGVTGQGGYFGEGFEVAAEGSSGGVFGILSCHFRKIGRRYFQDSFASPQDYRIDDKRMGQGWRKGRCKGGVPVPLTVRKRRGRVMAMEERTEGVILKKAGEVARLVLSRPERMNVMRPADLRHLWQYMVTVEADEAVRVLVLEGEGDRAFCAGLDLSGWKGAGLAEMRRRAREARVVINRLAELALPTVALVRGVAAGLGLELCLACDIVLAEEGARFGFPEVMLGLLPWAGGVRRLARAVGDKRAAEMVLLGGMVEAGTAASWGLVNEVCPPGELEKSLERMVNGLLRGSRAAQVAAKRALRAARDGISPSEGDFELELLTSALALGDGRERISSLLPKESGERPSGERREGVTEEATDR